MGTVTMTASAQRAPKAAALLGAGDEDTVALWWESGTVCCGLDLDAERAVAALSAGTLPTTYELALGVRLAATLSYLRNGRQLRALVRRLNRQLSDGPPSSWPMGRHPADLAVLACLDTKVKVNLAKHRHTPLPVLEVLSRDPSSQVRANAGWHRSASVEMLVHLSCGDPGVQRSVLSSITEYRATSQVAAWLIALPKTPGWEERALVPRWDELADARIPMFEDSWDFTRGPGAARASRKLLARLREFPDPEVRALAEHLIRFSGETIPAGAGWVCEPLCYRHGDDPIDRVFAWPRHVLRCRWRVGA